MIYYLLEESLLTLLDASAHEVLNRSPWLFRATPAQKAAAGGYLAWRKACEEQGLVYAVALGPIVSMGVMLRRFSATP